MVPQQERDYWKAQIERAREQMKSHTYNGETFKVEKGLSRKDADKFCAALLAYQSRAKGDQGETYFEVDRMPEDYRASEAPRKGRGRPRKVLAPITGESVLEGHTGANPAMDALRRNVSGKVASGEATSIVEMPASHVLYDQGCYREPCKTCGEGIPRTGKRGRAPIYHEECRPTEGI